MRTSGTKLLAVLALCSATTLGACAMDDANSGDDTTGIDGTVNSDAVTNDGTTNSSEDEQLSIVNPDGIIVDISVRQWQTDLQAWQIFFHTCRPSVMIDGDFGQMTTMATMCFQRINKLQDDGIVGPKTLTAMCKNLIFSMSRFDLAMASGCSV